MLAKIVDLILLAATPAINLTHLILDAAPTMWQTMSAWIIPEVR